MTLKGFILKKFNFEKKEQLVKLAKTRGFRNSASSRRVCVFVPTNKKNGAFCSFYREKLTELKRNPKEDKKNILRLEIPQNFSMIENCEKTMDVFEKLVFSTNNNKVKKIFFNQENCRNIDLCAETVAAVLLKDLNDADRKKKINLSGRYPQDDDLMRIVCASGVTKYLKISNLNPQDMLLFELREGRRTKSTATTSTEKEIQSGKLIEYLDDCLNSCGWELKKEGKQYLSRIVAEILDNAEGHSKTSSWWINAYLKNTGNKTGECHLVIFNFGIPIYESMKDVLSTKSPLNGAITRLIKQHSSRKFFSKVWDENVLLTLYSLQEGVSSKLSTDPTRGNGLADLVQFFQKIGKSADKDPVMVLISGDVFIKFDNVYEMKIVTDNGNKRRQIAFNTNNSLMDPPDPDKVKKIKRYFPGTLYSFKFYIDNDYMEKLQNGSPTT